jgi:hypothetical protein
MNASAPESPDTQSRAVKNQNRFSLRAKTRPLSPMEHAIVNANNIVRNQITGHRFTEFSIDGPNETGFIGVDSFAGMPIAGSHEYNPQGVVTGYGFKAFADEIDLPDLFIWADLGGGAGDFYFHTMLFEASGNSQHLATRIDEKAGGNQDDPLSTAVAIGGTNDVFWA